MYISHALRVRQAKAFTKIGTKPVASPRSNFRGGDEGIRTLDPHVANVVLSQLSYIPTGYYAFARGNILPVIRLFVK